MALIDAARPSDMPGTAASQAYRNAAGDQQSRPAPHGFDSRRSAPHDPPRLPRRTTPPWPPPTMGPPTARPDHGGRDRTTHRTARRAARPTVAAAQSGCALPAQSGYALPRNRATRSRAIGLRAPDRTPPGTPIKGDRNDQGQTHAEARSNHVRLPLIDGPKATRGPRRLRTGRSWCRSVPRRPSRARRRCRCPRRDRRRRCRRSR
jgi:hypothetical protein